MMLLFLSFAVSLVIVFSKPGSTAELLGVVAGAALVVNLLIQNLR